MFLILSGVSGSGKQTIINQLLQEYENSQFLKSVTTRPPRTERNHQYLHLTEEEFEEKRKQGEFFEIESTHGFHYGILNKSIEELLYNPDTLYMKDVGVQGTENLLKVLKDKMKIISIFLEVPDEILFDRLIKRGESEERARIRIGRGKMERKYKHQYDFVIDNIDLQKTLKQIRKIIDNVR